MTLEIFKLKIMNKSQKDLIDFAQGLGWSTDKQLADLLGVGDSHANRVKNGKANISKRSKEIASSSLAETLYSRLQFLGLGINNEQ